jgi:hypothetical protein
VNISTFVTKSRATSKTSEHRAAPSAKTQLGEQMIFVAGYIAALVTFVAADMVWLGIMVEKFYPPAIGDMLSTSVVAGT